MVQPPRFEKAFMKNTLTQLLEQLQADGLPCALDEEGDIVFVHQGLSYALCLDAEDSHFGCLLLPRVWSLESSQPAGQALAALNEINDRLKLVKGVLSQGSISFVIELWLPDPLAWRQCIGRACDTLVHAIHLFVDAMDGVQSELQSRPRDDQHRT